ncbi:hypothetical protein FDK21_12885 [Cohaesibacter sp. CAU 1516]|uniref:hypothetical protein n=1 Tax=Cohaesibacter sp. CAU 1516 TaxID=2576038 RepID=UPI0010FED8FB|nr:hypothetical protein [Cohaesibacter sp. CAU 1516]TLP45634.1 hypothetical protein FDK21_12885 [Cohaesibacter sp. CAU 1516]
MGNSMGKMASGYLDFLEGLYGRAAIDQMMETSGLDRAEIEKASDAFAPAFLDSLAKMRDQSLAAFGNSAATSDLSSLWPSEMSDLMQGFLKEANKAAQSFAKSPDTDANASAFPFSLYAEQMDRMEKLNTVFMGQMAQAQLLEEATRTTGISASQLKSLFPMLTTFGLMPLMPQMATPSLNDPTSWMEYLGAMGRRNFREANRDFDAMPSPLHAAFEGLLAGLYPQKSKAPSPSSAAKPDRAQEMQTAAMELQANYLKGLNSLFEHYVPARNQPSASNDDQT